MRTANWLVAGARARRETSFIERRGSNAPLSGAGWDDPSERVAHHLLGEVDSGDSDFEVTLP
jgi:hypothetical protein